MKIWPATGFGKLDVRGLTGGFVVGAVGFLAATFFSSIALVPVHLAIPALASFVGLLVVGPAAEELLRVTILKKRQDLGHTPMTLLSFALGWFLAELGIKLLGGVDFRVSRFCGFDYVGSLQPLVLHAMYTYLSWVILKRSKNVLLAIGATLSVHIMYNISVLVSDILGMTFIEIDDLFTMLAFAVCLFFASRLRKINPNVSGVAVD